MAMTTEQVLKVSTLEAVKNVTDLKNNISELKRVINGWTEVTEEDGKKVVKTYEGLTIGSKEYQQAVQQLNENQAALRNAMHGTAASMDEVKAAAKGLTSEMSDTDAVMAETTQKVNSADTSYNELVRTLAQLKEAWRSSTDTMERANIGKAINEVNNRLKEMDASVGNYQRNVGMYANVVDQLGSSFAATAGGAGKVIAPIKSATAGLKALSATPAIAILGLLANILTKIIDALKSSEEGISGVSAAFGVFAGIGDTVKAVLQNVAQGLGWLATQFVNLLDKIGLVNDKMKTQQEIAQEEIRIAKQQRDATMRNAEAERDIAELRAKATDKEKYSTQERIAFLEQASVKEQEIAERSRKAAKDEYDLIVKRNSTTKSSTEALKAEADAYARMIAADTNYQNAVRRNTRELNAARKEAAREEKERIKEQTDAQKARLDAEKEMLTQEISLLAEGSQERLSKEKDLAALEYQISVNNARAKIKNQEDLDRQLELLEKIYTANIAKIDRDFEAAQLAEAYQVERNKVEVLEKGSAEYLAALVHLQQVQYDTLAQMEGESDAEYEARRIAAWNALKDARQAVLDQQREQEAQAEENRLTLVRENQFQEMENEVALREWQLEKLREYGRKEGETEEAFRARELAAEKAFYDAKKKQRQLWLNTMKSAAGAVSGILGSIADMYEQNTEMTEAEAKKAKNLRIASATIDMIQGAVTAFSTAQQLGPIAGPIVGALNAAAVVAAGMANIAKIRATDVSKDGSGNTIAATVPATVAAPSVEPTVQETRTITSASEEDRLNRMASSQRVYILSSDLEADREQTRVRVAESTF